MATYKVPQDVEADDKLIGPFSFRQFIYLIIVALAGLIAWGLSQIFIGLAIIPAPIILLFGALALPLRKDQPMEIYLAAMVSFYLKPRQRKWDPEGVESLIEVMAPKVIEESRTKSLSGAEADRRLGYLASIVDSGGWAIRGTGTSPDSAMISDVFYDSQNVQDVLDNNNTVAQSFSYLMDQNSEKQRQEALDKMRQILASSQQPEPTPTENPIQTIQPILPSFPISETQNTLNTTPAPTSSTIQASQAMPHAIESDPMVGFNPYKSDLDQSVASQETQTPEVTPEATSVEATESTSDNSVSADIINLATNPDLSVATLSKEARRLQEKAASEGEIYLSLR